MPEDGTFDRWPLVGHRDALLILQRMSPPETLTLCTLSDGHRLSTHIMCFIKQTLYYFSRILIMIAKKGLNLSFT